MSDAGITKIEEIQVGDFIRFHGGDRGGRYSYTGEVTKVFIPDSKKDENLEPCFEMLTFDGTMGFVWNGEEEFELYKASTKPKGWAKFKKNPSGFREQVEEEQKVEYVKPKKQQVFELVAENKRVRKVETLVNRAHKEIGGSKALLRKYVELALSKK